MEVLGNFQQKYRFEMNVPNYNYSFTQIYGLVVFLLTYFVRFLIMLQLHPYLILLNISVFEIHL